MSNITLTARGRAVKTVFIIICSAIALFLAMIFVSWLSGIVHQDDIIEPHIECVQDTVLQADGSCTPQENL